MRNCSALFCGNFQWNWWKIFHSIYENVFIESTAYFRKIYGNFPWNQRHISVKSTETFHGINGIFPWNLQHCSMESTAYFHRNYSIVPWNPLNFRGINDKNLWHFMNFHNFFCWFICHQLPWKPLKRRPNTP